MAPGPKKRKAIAEDSKNKAARKTLSETPRYGVEVVTVEVGEGDDKTQFVVHKVLLSTHSEFFRAALRKEWKEGQDNQVPPEEQNPETFQLFQHFIYSGCVYSEKGGDRFYPDEFGKCQSDEEWTSLPNAWIFGEAILSTSFKDAVVDAIVVKAVRSGYKPTGMQDLVYPASPPKAGIRALIIDIAVHGWTDNVFESLASNGPSEFFFDHAIAFHKMKTNAWEADAPYKCENTCRYHEHGEMGTCYKDMF